jgi:hypothetical protein
MMCKQSKVEDDEGKPNGMHEPQTAKTWGTRTSASTASQPQEIDIRLRSVQHEACKHDTQYWRLVKAEYPS